MNSLTPMLTLANPAVIAVAVIVALIVFGIVIFMFRFLGLWILALVSGAPVSLPQLVGMQFRKVNPRVIVHSRIQAVKAGLNISTDQLEVHYLAGGNVQRVVNALIAADRNYVEMDWDMASAIDLGGGDPLAEVQALANPTPRG